MTPETQSTIATISIIAGPLIAVIGVILGAAWSRRTGKEDNNIAAFQANITAFTVRAEAAEKAALEAKKESSATSLRADEQDRKIQELTEQLDEERKLRKKDREEVDRIRTVIQQWFTRLQTWASTVNEPMPLLPDEDMKWLGLERTVASVPKFPAKE